MSFLSRSDSVTSLSPREGQKFFDDDEAGSDISDIAVDEQLRLIERTFQYFSPLPYATPPRSSCCAPLTQSMAQGLISRSYWKKVASCVSTLSCSLLLCPCLPCFYYTCKDYGRQVEYVTTSDIIKNCAKQRQLIIDTIPDIIHLETFPSSFPDSQRMTSPIMKGCGRNTLLLHVHGREKQTEGVIVIREERIPDLDGITRLTAYHLTDHEELPIRDIPSIIRMEHERYILENAITFMFKDHEDLPILEEGPVNFDRLQEPIMKYASGKVVMKISSKPDTSYQEWGYVICETSGQALIHIEGLPALKKIPITHVRQILEGVHPIYRLSCDRAQA